MRVLVTGGTGFIGRRLCERLQEHHHETVVLSRGERGEAVFRWQPLSEPAPVEAIDSCDAVVHLAGENIAGRWTQQKKQRIYDSRVVGTRNLLGGIARARRRPRVLVSASGVGYYGNDRKDEVLTEQSPRGEGFLADLSAAWEAEAEQAEALGVRVVRLRNSTVLDTGGGALPPMVKQFRWGAGGKLGSGRQWVSWIHREDLINLILYVMQNEIIHGPVNAAAPEPVRNAEFARTLARALHRPAWFPVPVPVLRLLLGEFGELVLGSLRVIPQAALNAGFQFRYVDVESALRAILV